MEREGRGREGEEVIKDKEEGEVREGKREKRYNVSTMHVHTCTCIWMRI